MNYEYYGYKSSLSNPNLEEAMELLNGPVNRSNAVEDLRVKALELADVIKSIDPRFEILMFDHEHPSNGSRNSLDDVGLKFTHIEMNNEDGEFTVAIFDQLVQLSVPLLFTVTNIERVFFRILIFIKKFSLETGYIFYDPQADLLIEPSLVNSLSDKHYLRLSRQITKTSFKSGKRKSFHWLSSLKRIISKPF
jgi:hypothetical protein